MTINVDNPFLFMIYDKDNIKEWEGCNNRLDNIAYTFFQQDLDFIYGKNHGPEFLTVELFIKNKCFNKEYYILAYNLLREEKINKIRERIR